MSRVVSRWIVGFLLLAGGLSLWAGVATGGETPLDAWWHDVVASLTGEPILATALVLNHVGAGVVGVFVVPVVIAGLLWVFRGWRTAVFAVTTFAVSALAVQVLKTLVARDRPADILVTADFGSFPSGHTANAATIAVVLWLLFPRVWVLVLGLAWTVLMAFSRTALAAHWLTDTVGGAVVGTGVALLCGALLLQWVQGREEEGTHRGSG